LELFVFSSEFIFAVPLIYASPEFYFAGSFGVEVEFTGSTGHALHGATQPAQPLLLSASFV